MNSPLILGVGEILWDLLPAGRQLGGAVTNFAFHASQLGGDGRIVSAVGDDAPGREIFGQLERLGLADQMIQLDPDHPTGTVDVTLDAHGKPTYTIHENVAWDFVRWTGDFELVARRADAICFGSLAQRSPVTRRTIHQLLSASGAETLCVFDINLRQQFFSAEVIEASLSAADVLKLSDEELPVVARLLNIDGQEEPVMCRLIERFDLKLIVLTRGGHGSTLVSPAERSDHPGVPARVVDTVGAGDSFTAAVVMGMLRGKPLAETNDHANRVAAYLCSQAGGTPVLPMELR